MRHHGEHAIVIGASMGGLAAAAALAGHFARVTVIDRDVLPATPEPRRGVPQGRHAHGLQPGGLTALEELLPGLTDQLAAGGATSGDIGAQVGWFVGGGWLARAHAGGLGIGCTRPFLEHHVRARVAALPGVSLLDGVQVDGLLTRREPDGARVSGVRLATGAEVPADLVVDASGRASALPRWLGELGYEAPSEERVHCNMAYLTRRWLLRAGALEGDVVTVIATGAAPHFGVAIAQEDGSHVVTLGGLLGAAPARNDEAYLEFAANLPDPRIGRALAGAQPVTEYQPSHFPCSVRRRYDRLRRFPSGLLATADAVASFNPMYGQGMTVAALEAVALRRQLDRGALDARRFFRAAHRIEDVAWKISAAGDLRYPTVRGRRTPDMAVTNRYLDRVLRAARTDPELAVRFLRVSGFVDRPEALFKPSVLRRVLLRRVPRPAEAVAAAQLAVERERPVRAVR